MSFTFQINSRTALRIDSARDLTPAVFQIEYTKSFEGKAY